MAGYVRQSAADIQAGLIVKSAIFNKEFDALASAFSVGGHTHDGTTGNGPKIDIVNSTTGILPESRVNLINYVKSETSLVPDYVAVFSGNTGKVLKDGGYTVNQMLNRSHHLGVQSMSTIVNLESTLNGKLNLSGGKMTGILDIEHATRHIRLYGPGDKLIEFYDPDGAKSGGIYQSNASKSFVVSPWSTPGTSSSATYFVFRPDGDLVLPNNTPVDDKAATSKKFVNDGLAGKINVGDADKTTITNVTSAMTSAPLGDVDETNDRLFVLVNGAPAKRMGWSTVKTWIKSWLTKSDVGLGNVVNLPPEDLPISSETKEYVDGRTSLISGYRNKLINGDFRIAQRGTSFTVAPLAAATFTSDRWAVYNSTNAPVEVTVVDNGTSDPALMFRFTSQPTSGEVTLFQKVEDVRTMPQGDATLTFGLFLENSMRVFQYGEQNFGTGGSATKVLQILNQIEPSSTTFVKKSSKFIVDSIEGKTAFPSSSNFNLCIQFHPRSIGYFGVNRASLVIGDATKEDDPFSPRHRQQELALCQRYYCRVSARYWAAYAGYMGYTVQLPVSMRAAPTTHLQNNSSSGIRVLRVENPQPLKVDLVAESDGNTQGCYFDALVYCNSEL